MTPTPPLTVVAEFVDCINRGDAAGLGALMTDDHELRVFDESPRRGKEANVDAWRGYAAAFPTYTIVAHQSSSTEDGSPCSGTRPARTWRCPPRRSRRSR